MKLSKIQMDAYKRARAIYESEWIWLVLSMKESGRRYKGEVISYLYHAGILHKRTYLCKCPLCDLPLCNSFQLGLMDLDSIIDCMCVNCPWPGNKENKIRCEKSGPYSDWVAHREDQTQNDCANEVYKLIKTFY